jgi:hypothetical protein
MWLVDQFFCSIYALCAPTCRHAKRSVYGRLRFVHEAIVDQTLKNRSLSETSSETITSAFNRCATPYLLKKTTMDRRKFWGNRGWYWRFGSGGSQSQRNIDNLNGMQQASKPSSVHRSNAILFFEPMLDMIRQGTFGIRASINSPH